ncbi:MAG: hypothetical protein HOI47_02265 [Candidatus Scalindua sp.]|jgi:hypothetical protein|nr:hypothetical protein [Candidatus Scalindua sp.]
MNKELIKEAIKETFEAEIKPFYVERQQHYDDYQKSQRLDHVDIDFLVNARKFVEAIRDTFWKTIFRAIILFFFSVLTGGLIFWYKYHDKIPPVHKHGQ